MKNVWNSYIVQFYFFSVILCFIMADSKETIDQQVEQATFGSGCFWCVEAVFERLNGVVNVRAGYTGGSAENPTYEEICAGTTGHAEVVKIEYNPRIISFEKLLDIFWVSHDPTTLNRQGADTGSQYRSAIFYHSDEQMKIAEASIKEAEKSGMYEDSIVTEIIPLTTFYPAEEYHQNYFRLNPNAPYCKLVIKPKLEKLNKHIN